MVSTRAVARVAGVFALAAGVACGSDDRAVVGPSGDGGAGAAGGSGGSGGSSGSSGSAGGAGAGGSAGSGGSAGTGGLGGSSGAAGAAGAAGFGGSGGSGGACGDTSHDVQNCGACGHVCSSNHGTPSCSSGTCGISCDAGYENCDQDVTNGCEINLQTDPLKCGTCSNTCPARPQAAPACTSGQCDIACDPGYQNCDQDKTNGCETDVTTVTNCGICGTVCSTTNGTPSCVGGVCKMASCTTGYADCDQDPTNGCEANTDWDPKNCGTCGNACPAGANQTATCFTVTTPTCGAPCAPGFGDCDGNAANGCETDVTTDFSNCGACGQSCGDSASSCVSSMCTPVVLASGLSNTMGIATDGASVYWTDISAGTVQKVSVAGGTVTTLASGQTNPHDIALGGDLYVYWTNQGTSPNYTDGSVRKALSFTPSTPVVLAASQQSAFGIAVSGGFVYWTTWTTSGSVLKITTSGTGLTSVRSGLLGPRFVTANATGAFWTAIGSDSVTPYPQNGSVWGTTSILALATGQNYPAGIVSDGTSVWWAALGVVTRVGASGTPTALTWASTPGCTAVLAMDPSSSKLFFTSCGELRRTDTVFGFSTKVAANLAGWPVRMAADSKFVYWTTGFLGTVMKVAWF